MTISNNFVKEIMKILDEKQKTQFLTWENINDYFIVRTRGNGYLYFQECFVRRYVDLNGGLGFPNYNFVRTDKYYDLKIYNEKEHWNLNINDQLLNNNIEINGDYVNKRIMELKAGNLYLLPNIGNVKESILLERLYEIGTREFLCRPSSHFI